MACWRGCHGNRQHHLGDSKHESEFNIILCLKPPKNIDKMNHGYSGRFPMKCPSKIFSLESAKCHLFHSHFPISI